MGLLILSDFEHYSIRAYVEACFVRSQIGWRRLWQGEDAQLFLYDRAYKLRIEQSHHFYFAC
jgi:hypothetical protein